ncbi:acyl-CoA-binding domain-containing protein 7-like [Artibeus jamaicensis]|uniref:acyl-CoA-binding domain-containing protein 7-like n=1 Tax=Artibeus jamaicensis TaxID=9417 RepID=UPI00235AE81E|nr:acyl-CoA-binding domain-containing protein 7-like [Artibeus jamaicensis]
MNTKHDLCPRQLSMYERKKLEQAIPVGLRLPSGGRGAVTVSLQADFDEAAEDVKKLKTRPDDEELEELYGLYKQSVIGDIDIGYPGMLELQGKTEWEAWNLQKESSKEDATSAYISKAKELIEKYRIYNPAYEKTFPSKPS